MYMGATYQSSTLEWEKSATIMAKNPSCSNEAHWCMPSFYLRLCQESHYKCTQHTTPYALTKTLYTKLSQSVSPCKFWVIIHVHIDGVSTT